MIHDWIEINSEVLWKGRHAVVREIETTPLGDVMVTIRANRKHSDLAVTPFDPVKADELRPDTPLELLKWNVEQALELVNEACNEIDRLACDKDIEDQVRTLRTGRCDLAKASRRAGDATRRLRLIQNLLDQGEV